MVKWSRTHCLLWLNRNSATMGNLRTVPLFFTLFVASFARVAVSETPCDQWRPKVIRNCLSPSQVHILRVSESCDDCVSRHCSARITLVRRPRTTATVGPSQVCRGPIYDALAVRRLCSPPMSGPQDAAAQIHGQAASGPGEFTTSRYVTREWRFTAVRGCAQRMAEVAGLPLAFAEPVSLTRYSIGQRYHLHQDSVYSHLARYGQRHVTAIAYLSNTTAGGETVFPRSGGPPSSECTSNKLELCCTPSSSSLKVMPVAGSCVVFRNHHVAPGNVTPVADPCSIHAACPVIAGEKWIAQLWLHSEPWDKGPEGLFW